MLKRFIALFLALLMCLGCCSALAEGLRHKVHGDVSEFEVSEELDQDTVNGDQAQVGTDVYLYVDPYTASYVTFVVVDEDGRPVKGAAIYLSYGGETEFYGTTDSDGKFSTYVFRDTTYGFTIKKNGYRTETGKFKATRETKTIRVVLRKLNRLDIIVLKDGEPVPDIKVVFNGAKGTTGKDGSVQFWPVRGTYDAEIYLPDGTVKTVTINIQGNTVYIVEIGTEDWPEDIPQELLNGGGGLSDTFIVFDKYYRPEDYDLIQQVFTDEEILAQLDADALTEEEIDAAVLAYHEENEDYLHIIAEPDKIQHDDAPDEIVYDENGEAVYSQRSLILSGWQLLNVENLDMESILFENENMGLWFDIADLYSEDMAKLFKLIKAAKENPKEYEWFDRKEFEVGDIPFDELPDVWRWIDPEEEYNEEIQVLSRSEFGNSRLEVRITPIQAEEVMRAALGIEENIPAESVSEILLISDELREKWLKEYLADGFLSDTEYAEMLDVCVHGTAYRIQVFLKIDGLLVNVSEMLDSLEVRMDVNEEIVVEADEYAWKQIEELFRTQQDEGKKSLDQLAEEHYEALCEEYYADVYAAVHGYYGVRNEGLQLDDKEYLPGNAAIVGAPVPDDGVTKVEEFYNALNSRLVDVLDVDVRFEEYEYKGNIGYRYYPVAVCDEDVFIPVQRDWHVNWQNKQSGMYLIRETGCDCVEILRQAMLPEEK